MNREPKCTVGWGRSSGAFAQCHLVEFVRQAGHWHVLPGSLYIVSLAAEGVPLLRWTICFCWCVKPFSVTILTLNERKSHWPGTKTGAEWTTTVPSFLSLKPPVYFLASGCELYFTQLSSKLQILMCCTYLACAQPVARSGQGSWNQLAYSYCDLLVKYAAVHNHLIF